MKYFIEFSYKGTNYHGWQTQPKQISVQEILTKTLSILFKKNIELIGAGRTDSGVHAKQMYAHFEIEKELDLVKIIPKINSFLPKDISVFNFHKVHDDAHARFDAKKRTYNYFIHTQKNAFECFDSWYYIKKLNVELMNQACQILLQNTDFECFSKTNTDVFTYNCTIFDAHWKQIDNQIIFTITADRFLRNMVRAIVGTMINIGLEKLTLQDLKSIIESKNRSKAGFSVPAHGLYLTKIEYDYIKK